MPCPLHLPQAVCFLPKDLCDVRQVEIARAVRLCKTTVEPIFIKVPRTRVSFHMSGCGQRIVHLPLHGRSFCVTYIYMYTPPCVPQTEYFQDDIIPETRVRWQSALTGQEWLAGGNAVQPYISLRPADMKLRELNTLSVILSSR